MAMVDEEFYDTKDGIKEKLSIIKLARISVGQKSETSETPPGIRENLMLDRGRYTIAVEYPLKKEKEAKDKKVINNATHFVVYWCKDCKDSIFSEKQQKFIGIYENKGLITIDSEEEFIINRINYLGMENILSESPERRQEKFERHLRQFRIGRRKCYGAYLNKIYDGVLDFPEKVNVRCDFGNIKKEKNIQYIQDIIIKNYIK